jgi:hypothetical protein
MATAADERLIIVPQEPPAAKHTSIHTRGTLSKKRAVQRLPKTSKMMVCTTYQHGTTPASM